MALLLEAPAASSLGCNCRFGGVEDSPVLRGVLGFACAMLLCSSSCHVHYSSGVHNDCDNRNGSQDGCGDDTGGAAGGTSAHG